MDRLLRLLPTVFLIVLVARPTLATQDAQSPASIMGFTEDQVRAIFGPPSLPEKASDGSLTWYYDGTSQGTVRIYFANGRVIRMAPDNMVQELQSRGADRRRNSAPPKAQVELPIPPDLRDQIAEQTVSTKPTYKLNNGEPLDEKMAIAAAEKFIADNGYTDLPPMKDKSGLAHESIEWTNDVDELLQQRHDSLERKAYAITKHGRAGPGWTVGFRYKRGGDIAGRAVTMDINGGNIRLEHQDVFLQKLDKKLFP
jgi:hypothetical protein